MAVGVAACSGGAGTVDDDPFASPVRQPAGVGGDGGQGSGTQPGTAPNAAGAQSGLPEWVRVGTRLTWYVAAASIAQSRFAWVEDPNGTWEDPKTGKRYSRTDEGPDGQSGPGQPGASGDGFSQLDVVAIEGSDVVLENNIYTINRTSAQPTLGWTIGLGAKVSGVAVDGAWIHPAVLRQYLERNTGGLLVLRGPYNVGGRTYAATAVATTTAGAYQSYTYDSESGILLAASTNTAGATSPFAAPGENPPAGNSQLTYTQFLGLRERAMPGMGAVAPGWVAGTPTLRYGGTYSITNPIDPGSGSFTSQAQYTIAFGKGGATWAPYQVRGFVQTLGEQAVVNSVSTSTGLYWYDPAALTRMTPGQVLDQDPLTGQQVVVAEAGGGAGGNIVVIDRAIPGVLGRAAYDRSSGIMVTYDLQLPPSGTRIQLQLQGG